MVSFHDALRSVLECVPRLGPTRVPLPDAVGLVLAEDVASDVDMPPFDKSAMDGFAVVASDLARVPRTLRVVEEVPAGAVPKHPVGPGECARIMTGAPVPEGADAVVRIEDTEPGRSPGKVVIRKEAAKDANICFKAEDVARGDVVLPAGHLIGILDVPTLAACGCVRVPAFRRPEVALLSTGNEVVPVHRVPKGGQIRDANAPYLAARLRRLGIRPDLLGIAPDKPDRLKVFLSRGLNADVLLVSGGVSMGDYDLVPGILRELGVEVLFDSVAMQPGRPTLFGRCRNSFVFGLPGNPVSVLIAAELLALPALKKMMGYGEPSAPRHRARLLEPVRHRPGRLAHLPGVLAEWADGWEVRPLPYHGSAHVHALCQANCLIALPADATAIEPPATVEVVMLPSNP
ncbi:MAG: molybdopterin molybdotransferase MoeA [Planctomycetes bacterium]|nr:molybdopterin molybdotransferase MoeA [Planctomycetota bacterium]